jgi:NADH-quinone oxidoreductase subunit M
LLAVGTLLPYLELRIRKKPTRVYVIHMALFVVLMVAGWLLIEAEGRYAAHSVWALVPLLLAVLIRSGIAPFHCWVTDLFEHATFGTALLYVTPMLGAYAAVRLVLPTSPDWVLQSLGMLSLVTAVYAAGMAIVQREARRFFCYIFLSHSALVLVGLETVNELGLTGALCVWLSVGLSLAGFGLTLRALEARHGRLALTSFRGLYEHTPILGICFLLTGMASVGFPGTIGFLGMELLIDGAVQAYPHVGVAVVIAAAINGIAVMQVYFRLFAGTRHVTSVSLQMGRRERLAVLTLTLLIVAGGIFPQAGVVSRYHAAEGILRERQNLAAEHQSPRSVARRETQQPHVSPPTR